MYLDTFFKSGDWNAICDRCGVRFKASELRKTWEGYMVCEQDWEPRHPLDFIRAPHPIAPVAYTRQEAPDQFVDVAYISTSVGSQDTTIPTGHNDGDL